MRKLTIAAVALAALIGGALLYPIVPDTDAAPSAPRSVLPATLSTQLNAYIDDQPAVDAVVVANASSVLFEAGPTHTPINTHSVRKSLMNVLFGMAVLEGRLDVHATLAELDFDDAVMPLTDAEKQARVADLLKARSGIYIEASGETAEMKASRPRRGQHAPGSFYYYNNWDFNSLGAILSRTTGQELAGHLDMLARRVGWQDYQTDHLMFSQASGSEHDQYIIYLSARDLAAVGQMVLRGGLDAHGEPLVSDAWLSASFQPYSELKDREPLDSYGYLWSIDEDDGTVWATGWGGQYLLIDRANDLVVVTRNHTGRRVGSFLWLVALGNSTQGRLSQTAKLHEMLMQAQ